MLVTAKPVHSLLNHTTVPGRTFIDELVTTVYSLS